MTMRTWVLAVIQRVTGRTVRLNAAVTNSAFMGYVARQGRAFVRGWLAQCCALRRPVPVFLGAGARLRGLSSMLYGRNLRLGDRTELQCWSRGGIVLGANVSIGEHSCISNGFNPFGDIGRVKISDNVGIGGFSYICCPSSLEIGEGTITGQYLSIHPQNHEFSDHAVPIRLQGTSAQGVAIGANCWIGAKVTILDGVTLGDGCVIAAGAVVTQSFPANAIIGGVPAKRLGNR